MRCAVDRYWRLGTVQATDDCAAACVTAVTTLLDSEWRGAEETASILRSCADACEAVGSDVGAIGPEEYAYCARSCRRLADEMSAVQVAESR